MSLFLTTSKYFFSEISSAKRSFASTKKDKQEYSFIKFLYEINTNQWLKLIKA